MTEARVIGKSEVSDLLDQLAQERQVVAPARREGVVRYERIASGMEAALDCANSDAPPKEVFLPCSEQMFSYRDSQVEELLPRQPQVLFGVRPCDAHSFLLLDRVFGDPDHSDPYYLARREHTIVVGMSCTHPLSTCFCTSLGGGPFDTAGMDVMLSDLGEAYLVEVLSGKGRGLLEGNSLLERAGDSHLRAKEAVACQAERSIRSGVVTEGIKAQLDSMYDDPFWEELSQKCLGCGVCSFLCPTCHCFDILDEPENAEGWRTRLWDCCQFALFTLHASGHNPRPSAKERLRQRFMHKFSYFVANYGEVACVGCGRCVRRCPVNLDVRAVLGRVMER